MKIAVFSAKPYDREFLDAANAAQGTSLKYFESRSTPKRSSLAAGHDAVCIFVNDRADAEVLEALARGRHEPRRAALHRLQQRGPEGRRATRHQGGPGRRLFAHTRSPSTPSRC